MLGLRLSGHGLGGAVTNQDQVFFTREGDAWFQRNKAALSQGGKSDWPAELLKLLADPSDLARVLELGCANGWRLDKWHREFGLGSVRRVGVDASGEALRDGAARFPSIEFHQGMLADVPLEEEFDLVIVHFVLHWVDRRTLLSSIAEIDRLTKEGGLILLGDFLPDFPQRRRYHHVQDQDLYTYKQDYARIFEALGTYRELARVTFHHDQPASDLRRADSATRGACMLLQKSLQGYYPLIGS